MVKFIGKVLAATVGRFGVALVKGAVEILRSAGRAEELWKRIRSAE